MKFAPDYITHVLNENFEDAKTLFLGPLLSVHYAHLVMLVEQGIVSAGDAHGLRSALDSISEDAIRRVTYDGTYEDLFFYVERLIVASCDEDVAGRLHTARSRNDIDMTMYRMRQRGFVLDLFDATLALRRALIDVAARHRETVFPAHTHTQPAQPTTVAHYLLGVARAAGAGWRPAAGGLRHHQSQSARVVRDHRDGISDRSPPDRASSSGSADRPAIPTAASRRWTMSSRRCRPWPCSWSAWGAWSRTCCSGARWK